MVKRPPGSQLITDAPLTVEACEVFLRQLFDNDLPHIGEVFLPDDTFYIAGGRQMRATNMTKRLCGWLGIKPGYIGLILESLEEQLPDGSRHTIYLEKAVLADEFVLGATSAYALTRYLVEEQKQIRLPHHDQQDMLLATATIMFGLGLVMANGLLPTYSWSGSLRLRIKSPALLIGTYGLAHYMSDIRQFLRQHLINEAQYLPLLTPWARQRLGLSKSKRSSHAVLDARHTRLVINTKLLGVIWLLGLVLGIGSFAYLQRVMPVPAAVKDAQSQLSLLDELGHLCRDSLAYDKQYADMSDIQTVRVLNSEQLRCQSLQNQYDTAETDYRKLVQP